MKQLIFITIITLIVSNCYSQKKKNIPVAQIPDSVYNSILEKLNYREGWTYLAESQHQGEGRATYYIRNTYISKNYSVIKIWAKVEYSFKKLKGKIYKNVEAKSLYVFNCQTKTIQCEQIAYFNSSGSTIQTSDILFYDPEKVVAPDSIGELMLNKVCELFNN